MNGTPLYSWEIAIAERAKADETRRFLDEAVRLLERWEQRWQPMARIYVNAPLDGETAAFIVKARK